MQMANILRKMKTDNTMRNLIPGSSIGFRDEDDSEDV